MRMNELINSIDKIHTTELGIVRIKRNLNLSEEDVVDYCRNLIIDPLAEIERKGKNWYIKNSGVIITVNAYSYTIITAHMEK